MSLALILAAVVLGYLLVRVVGSRRSRGDAEVTRESTPALDRWLAEALEVELAAGALGMRASTPEERRKLARTLGGEPDPDVVSTIEDKVRAVELEFVKYSHDADAEVTVRVRYENGSSGTATTRLGWTDVPEAVRGDFELRGGTRVFRTWVFPWARVRAL